ncbi:MAG: hypothetical protein L0206_17405 [Actinobacteria bacterium]|nr:hypothetical protein [Actinomycetota bacterium]
MNKLRVVVALAMVSALAVAVPLIPAGAQPSCTRTGNDNANDMHSTSGPDVLCARGGDDRVAGRGGDDVLLGEGGDDLLLGGTGGDELRGGGEGDTLIGGPGQDLLLGGIGSDLIDATGGDADTVRAGGGMDVCFVDQDDSAGAASARSETRTATVRP